MYVKCVYVYVCMYVTADSFLSFERSLFTINLGYKLKGARHVGLAPHKNIYQEEITEVFKVHT